MNQGNAAGVSGAVVVTVLHKDVEQSEGRYRLTRKGTYSLQLTLVKLTYVAVVGEDEEIECSLEFVCNLATDEVCIYGLRGPQVAINDFLTNRRHYELHRAGSLTQRANAALVDYYHEVVDSLDEFLRTDQGLDARDERHAHASVSL